MADHLVRRHPSPAAGAVRPHRSQPAKDLGLVARPGQRLHAPPSRRHRWTVTRPSSRSPPASRNAASACSRPASASASSAWKRGIAPQRVELRAARERRRDEVALGDRAPELVEAPLVLADVAEQPALLEDRLRVVHDLQRAERRTCWRACPRAADRARPSGTRSTTGRPGCATPARIVEQRRRASSRRPASPRPMTRIPSSPPRDDRRRLDGQEPLDVARHQQRLLEAGGDVRVEPARLVVRGDRLLVEPAVAAGVDEPREQLRIVAVAVGLAEQAHQRAPAPGRCPPRGARRTCAPPRAAG